MMWFDVVVGKGRPVARADAPLLPLQQTLGAIDAIAQAHLEVGVLRAPRHVFGDRGTYDLRNRPIFD